MPLMSSNGLGLVIPNKGEGLGVPERGIGTLQQQKIGC